MTAFNRAPQLWNTLKSIYAQRFKDFEVIVVEDGDDGGDTRAACEAWPVRYIQRHRRPDVPYSNQAIPLNIGIRAARGRILILQNAECEHATPEVINRLAAPHRRRKALAVFASILYLRPNGLPDYWGSHPRFAGPSPYFFCGSLLRCVAERLGGFDEAFRGWGAEDDDFAFRMREGGVHFSFPEGVTVFHQWHQAARGYRKTENVEYYEHKVAQIRAGFRHLILANRGREWGRLDA